jgi:hypothetical protein
MRTLIIAPLLAGALMMPSAARAQVGRVEVQGFGGVTFRDFSNSSTFGGSVAAPLTNNIQVIGEFGRMSDVMAPTIATLLDVTPFDVRLRAFYGEGGVRILGGHGSGLRPYAEATAGFARLSLRYRTPTHVRTCCSTRGCNSSTRRSPCSASAPA